MGIEPDGWFYFKSGALRFQVFFHPQQKSFFIRHEEFWEDNWRLWYEKPATSTEVEMWEELQRLRK